MCKDQYESLRSRMTKELYPNGDCSWALDTKGLSDNLAVIHVDFIDSPWNAAQRFWGYLNDFGLTDRLRSEVKGNNPSR